MHSGKAIRLPALDQAHTNIALLFFSFVIGQGSLFVAQSLVVLWGSVDIVGQFGASFTFAVLVYALIDWGGIILLARHELSSDADQRAELFTCLVIVRSGVAIPLIIAITIWGSVRGIGDFASGYAVGVAPAMLLGVLNAGGVLDGVKRSGLTGLTTAAPMITSAFALPFATLLPAANRGLLLGGAFTMGTIVSLATQYLLLARLRDKRLIGRPSWHGVRVAAREGGLILLTLLPGYTFYRVQVGLAVWLLGPIGTGLFVYAKQIVNGVQQSVYFMRRAEMPRIMEVLRGPTTLADVARAQHIGLIAAIGLAGLLAVIGLGANIVLTGDIATAGLLAASFTPVIVVSASYAALHQAYVAAHRSATAAIVANCGLLFGLAASMLCVRFLGIYGFPIAELVMAIGLLIALSRLWRPEQSKTSR